MSELSEDYSQYSGSEFGSEVSVQSTLAELLERFTIDAQPECTLKLRAKTGPVIVGADLTRIMAANTYVGALVLKPSNANQMWRRLRVDNSGALTLRSRKLHWWLFTLDVIAHANPVSRSFDLSYRLATKWDVTKGEYRNKKCFELGPSTEARAHWSISYSLPAIEGSMGAAAQRVSREVHADVGYAHLSIPRLELVVWPRGRPEEPAGDSLPATASAAGCEGGDWEGGALASGGERFGGACADAAEGCGGGSSGAAGAVLAPAAATSNAIRSLADAGLASAAGAPTGRKARLQQLNSHVASLSGRWWDTYGKHQLSQQAQALC